MNGTEEVLYEKIAEEVPVDIGWGSGGESHKWKVMWLKTDREWASGEDLRIL